MKTLLRNLGLVSSVLVGVGFLSLGISSRSVLADTGETGGGGVSTKAVEKAARCLAYTKNTFVAGRGGSTTSTALTPVPSASVRFTTNKKGCIRIIFSAEAFTSGTNGLMFIDAQVDGSSVGVVPSTSKQFVASTGRFADYHTVVLHKTDLPPGNHTVTMRFSRSGGTSVNINEFNLSVDHR